MGESNEDALQAIERRFTEYSAALTTWDVQKQVNELLNAWAGVVSITVARSDETWQRLRREPLMSRLLVDTLSEAVTDAVRHGEMADIEVIIDTTEAEARVGSTVRSKGPLTDGVGNGTGLARLIDRGAQITLEQVHDYVVMEALL
jgi:hypothetical protein